MSTSSQTQELAASKFGDDLCVPRYHELVILAAIMVCGVFIGQAVRLARRVAEDYDQWSHT